MNKYYSSPRNSDVKAAADAVNEIVDELEKAMGTLSNTSDDKKALKVVMKSLKSLQNAGLQWELWLLEPFLDNLFQIIMGSRGDVKKV